MPNFNHAVLAGHLGRNPDSNSSGSVAKFSIAVNDQPKPGEERGKTHWLTVKCFRHVAEVAMSLTKGQGCHVTGRLAVEEWTGKDGSKKSAVVILADSIAPYPLKGAVAATLAMPTVTAPKQADPLNGPPSDDDVPF